MKMISRFGVRPTFLKENIVDTKLYQNPKDQQMHNDLDLRRKELFKNVFLTIM